MSWPQYITVFVFNSAHAVAETTIINRSLFDHITVSHTCRKTNFAPCPLPSSPLLCTPAVKTSPSTAKSASKSQSFMGLQPLIASTSPLRSQISTPLKPLLKPSSLQKFTLPQYFKCVSSAAIKASSFKYRISFCRVASKSPTCSLTKTTSRTAATLSSTNAKLLNSCLDLYVSCCAFVSPSPPALDL
ncbi:hypothetical protein R3P38DRAFT_3203870 [Favolaschia claudopus]|uniref:Uncharacterized protein n=1 Tax=Favolaschia claudopus TaxID=2862362 RepID=A0AAW0ARQ5_9AGAR